MRTLRLGALLCAWTILGCECGTGPVQRAGPLVLLDVDPATSTVGVDSTFKLTFSSEVNADSVGFESVMLIPTERVNESFFSDLRNPPLSSDRRAAIIPSTLRTNGAEVTLTPSAPLAYNTALSIVVAASVKGTNNQGLVAANGNADAVQIDVTTEAEPPKVVETSLPSGTPAVVPTNMRVIQLVSDQPLQNASVDAARVIGVGGVANVDIESVEVLSDGKTVRVRLQDGACRPLCPTGDYQLEVGAPLQNALGQPLTTFRADLRTLATADTDGPQLRYLPFIRASETDAAVRVVVSEAMSGTMRLGAPGGPYDTTFVFRVADRCTGIAAARECPYRTEATGLDLGGGGTGRDYEFMLDLVDDYGNLAVYGPFPLRTVKLPLLVVTELYPNPPGTTEGGAEFIEVTNVSDTVTYDLVGMWVATIDLETGLTDKSMELFPYTEESPTVIGPGQRAVIGGSRFDPRSVGTPEDAVVFIDGNRIRTTLLGGIASGVDTRKGVALFMGDPSQGAALVSFYSAPADLYSPGGSFPEGVSAERTTLTGSDLDAIWCHSATAPTPAQPNSVEGLATCPLPTP